MTRLLALAALILLCIATPALATTYTAVSCSYADVSAKADSAQNPGLANGDTVVVPSCPSGATWASQLTITKAIILQCAGIGNTIIKDNATGSLLAWTIPAATSTSRLTGCEFQDGGRASQYFFGIFYFEGATSNDSQIRIDHNKFDHLNGVHIQPNDVFGVSDHNTHLSYATRIPYYVYNKRWSGSSYGDGSWAAATNFGGAGFFFIENNTFTFDLGSEYYCTDSYGGSRYVVRYNTTTRCAISAHGTDSGGRNRSTRAIEVYHNTFAGPAPASRVVDHRGGGMLVYDNVVSGMLTTPTANLTADRTFWAFGPFLAADSNAADGTNTWDVNLAGGPFATGTASSGSGQTVTVSGAGWTVNQWAAYSIVKTSTCNPASVQCASIITSNTSDTITYLDAGGFGTSMTFSAGNTFALYKVTHAMDQPGRALGGLVSGDTPSQPAGWNDQVTEPIYCWNNTYESGTWTCSAYTPNIRSGTHYINGTAMPGYAAYPYPHPLTQGATYTITASAGSNGSLAPSGSVAVSAGANQTFTLTPSTGYHVSDVLVDGVSVGAVSSYTFLAVGTNHTISATFAINTYTITATFGAHGTVAPSVGIVVNYGGSQAFTITADASYHVADVLVDGISVGAVTGYTFSNVTANHTISATFALNDYTITGTITLSGSPLANVSLAGASCSVTNALGQYSCGVSSGFSGAIAPSLMGYLFTPASRSYVTITSNQSSQNYTAATTPTSPTTTRSMKLKGGITIR